jgi:hypothetical protein
LMHWMSVKLPDNFQIREHSWPCRAGFILYNVTDRNSFSDTIPTCYLLSFGNLIVNPVHFLLRDNIKRHTRDTIIWFYYFIQNINIHVLMWFFCRINTILV